MAQPDRPTKANGKICYIEIPAIDVNVSATFYKKVFGWNIRQQSEGATSFDDTVGEVSGMWVTGREANTGQALVVHIMVDNIQVTMNLVVAHGGKLVQPPVFDAPELTALFSDPAGNVFGLYQEPLQ